ncbi:PREDICTED: protein Star [Ceratosolen solmsi marchali]|uniref:Protein Star n=1 Tax=Ceratosolen solmsi marchali TaxID=326594 RepID=A0AAJ7DUM6_9HYME|nr:PREDICTED: protein Star [Ceratosolen solmsi marchali]
MPNVDNAALGKRTFNMRPDIKLATADVTSTITAPSISNRNDDMLITKKPCCRRRTVHFTVFLAVFSTILSLLWIYTLTAELRRKAFDVNMTKDYVLYNISIDNPDLVAYIRNIRLKTSHQDLLNATRTPEEQFVVSQLQDKREGVYFEYLSRAGAISTTAWLEWNLNWRGVIVFTDPRNRSRRNPKTIVFHACLSTDKYIKEITYHQEADVQVMKLGEGHNSLVLSKESLPATRLMCFPLYSILLAYNTTNLDYLSLDSTEVQDGLVLDTVPWDLIKISVLSIHWGAHHTDTETKSIINKLGSHNYKHVKSLVTGKLLFVYNRQLKI